MGFMDIRGIWRKWKEQKRTNQKIENSKKKRETGNPPKPKKQDTGNPPKIGNPPKKEEKGGHRKSPKTDESRTENAPIEK